MTDISVSEYHSRPQTPLKPHPLASRTGLLTAAALAVTSICFLAGIQYQKSKTPVAAVVQTASSQGVPGRGFRGGVRAIGSVSAVSGSSITIQTRSGSVRTYTLTRSTTIRNNGQAGSVSDIQAGDTVMLALNAANTRDIDSIILNPNFGGEFGGEFAAPDNRSGGSTSGGTTSPTGV
jgi:hypothetical protein